MENLLTKYRPRTLDDVLGQDAIIRALKQFVRSPYPAAFLFHGESGIGKTAAAVALAGDLGLAADEQELGGLWEIPAGEMSADQVRAKMDALRPRPMFGSGWRVLIANEADKMTSAAETIWLDALERLPPQCVVIFTTNRPEKLTRRLRDRCEVYGFESGTEALQPYICQLAQRIWKGEKLKGRPPALDTLGMPTLGTIEDMHASFRLALQQLTKLIREAKSGDGDFVAVIDQMERDGRLQAADLEADCDHCGTTQKIDAGKKRQRCATCGKTFKVEYDATARGDA